MSSFTLTPIANSVGNRCGHIPSSPIFNLVEPAPTGKGGMPRVLTLLMERLEAYYNHVDSLPNLNVANDSDRKQRSERREACIRLLKAILKNTDLASLRVGFPTKNGFVCRNMKHLVGETGMKFRRCERAMKDLKAANIIYSKQPRILDDKGNMRGLASVRLVTKELFGAFGLRSMLDKEQAKASNRLKKQAREWDKRTLTDVARFKMVVGSFSNAVETKRQISARRKAAEKDSKSDWNKLAARVMSEHPDWSRPKIREEADRLLKLAV